MTDDEAKVYNWSLRGPTAKRRPRPPDETRGGGKSYEYSRCRGRSGSPNEVQSVSWPLGPWRNGSASVVVCARYHMQHGRRVASGSLRNVTVSTRRRQEASVTVSGHREVGEMRGDRRVADERERGGVRLFEARDRRVARDRPEIGPR